MFFGSDHFSKTCNCMSWKNELPNSFMMDNANSVSKLVCLALAAVCVWIAVQQVDTGIAVLAHHHIGSVSLASGIMHYFLAGLLVHLAADSSSCGGALIFSVLVVLVLNIINYKNVFSQRVISMWLGLALAGAVYTFASYRKELY